jgi:hypothetical protein
VEKSFSITNGTNAAGSDRNDLVNLMVGGSLTINNGAGDTDTKIHRSSSDLSTVGGNLSITNGSGFDSNFINDMNVGGNFTINNGHGDTQGRAGNTLLFNLPPGGSRSIVKGSFTLSYLDGDVVSPDSFTDMEVLGNATFNNGTGSATTSFDGNNIPLPDLIRGNLTVTGSGANTVTVGTAFHHTGLVVGKNLTITTGAAADTLTFNKLEVGGATKLSLGNGNSSVTIDDSVFTGAFTLTTGAGIDVVKLDTTAGSSAPTLFERPVLIAQGAGNDQVVRAGGGDANQELIVLSTFVIHHGAGNDTDTVGPAGHEVFPFGTSILWVV